MNWIGTRDSGIIKLGDNLEAGALCERRDGLPLPPVAVLVGADVGRRAGGSGSGGSGVRFSDDGANNTLNNHGTVTALSGAAVTASLAPTGGNETINNYGTIIGDIKFGVGTNFFDNKAGATFNAGPTVNLGASNFLSNSGNLSPGGIGTIQTTTLADSLGWRRS